MQQAQQAALKLGKFDLIATSSLQRALRTAQIIAEHKNMSDLHIDDRLKESHIGPWQGLTYAEIEAGWHPTPLGWIPAAPVTDEVTIGGMPVFSSQSNNGEHDDV